MGKLLHTYYLLPTSMATVPLSRYDNTLYVLLSFLSAVLSSLTVDSASFDLLTKPQPTKGLCFTPDGYSPIWIPRCFGVWELGEDFTPRDHQPLSLPNGTVTGLSYS